MLKVWHELKKSKIGILGLTLTLLLLLVAAGAPWIATGDPLQTSMHALEPPNSQVYFGTDHIGRDVWSGVIYGSRVSLLVGLSASLLSTFLGIIVGAIAGYRGGWMDVLLMRATEFFQIIPQFFLAVVLVAMVGRGIDKVVFVLGILGWPLTARVVRGQFLSLKEREFVQAARAVGATQLYVAIKVMLPNALPPVMITATQGVATAILLQAGVAFFGMGDPNLMSWGVMLHTAQGFLRSAWWMSVFPGLAIFIASLGFTLLGDGLNDALNPRLRR